MSPGALLDALNFVLAGAREGFGPFIAVYLQGEGFDPATTGIVMALAGLGGLLCTTPIGHLVDRSTRKRELLVVAVAVIAAGAVAIAVSKNIYYIGAGQLFIGIGDTALAPLLTAMTLGIVGLEAFPEKMSRNEAWNNAGSSTRSALAAALGFFFGLQYVAITILLSSLASAIVVKRIRPHDIDHVAARSGESSDEPAWRALLRLRGLLLLSFSVFIYQAASSAMLAYLAEARTDAGSDPSLTTGVMCVVSRGFMVPAALAAPAIARRSSYASVLSLVMMLVTARATLAYFADSWTLVILVEILEGFAVGLALVAIPVLNSEVMAGTGRTSAGLGLVLTAFGTGATVSPLIGGFLAQRFGFATSFLGFAMVAAAGLVVWWLGRFFLGDRSGFQQDLPEDKELPEALRRSRQQ